MRGIRSRRWLAGVLGAAAAMVLTAAFTVTPALAEDFAGPAMLVNGNDVDIAVPGPNNSLEFYYQQNGVAGWNTEQVAGAETTFSAPSMAVDGDYVDIAVEGPDDSLVLYYSALNGTGTWHSDQVTGPGTTFSAPSIAISGGNVEIVANGPGNSLYAYYTTSGSGTWTVEDVTNGGFIYSMSAPSMVISGGWVSIAMEGQEDTLYYWSQPVGGPSSSWDGWLIGTATSAPSIAATGNAINVSTTGANGEVLFYWVYDGSVLWHTETVAAGSPAYTATSIAVDSSANSAIIAATGLAGNLEFFSAVYGTGSWHSQGVSGPGSVSLAPVIYADSFDGYNGVNICAVGPQGQLLSDYSAFGSGTWYSETIAGPGSST